MKTRIHFSSRSFISLAVALACSLPPAVLPISSAQAQSLPSLGGTEGAELSPAMERRLGEEIMRDIRRDRDFLEDAPLQEYLNQLGADLVAARPDAGSEGIYDFFFFTVRDARLNAFALPGGFIGVHSALILAADNESELASVLAHEIGHVTQRHIARMIGNQRQDALIPLAGLILAALAASASPDAAAAAAMGSQGFAIQRQLNFSRVAEREADRVGLQIMRQGGYDASGMVAFFGRLQSASRSQGDGAPAYLRSHPLTTERVSDIQGRIRNQPYRQRQDDPDFQLIRARVRVLQDGSAQGLREAARFFESQLQQKNPQEIQAAQYGLALVALRQGAPAKAQTLLQPLQKEQADSALLADLAIEVALANQQTDAALEQAKAAQTRFPLSRAIAQRYADVLIAAGQHDQALRYLRDQVQLYRSEASLHERLAKVYAAQGKRAQQHMALAEAYALSVSLPAALDQLTIARRAPDASFYDQSVIDAREREFKARWRDELDAGSPFPD